MIGLIHFPQITFYNIPLILKDAMKIRNDVTLGSSDIFHAKDNSESLMQKNDVRNLVYDLSNLLIKALVLMFLLSSFTNLTAELDPAKVLAVFTIDKTDEDKFWAHITLENHSSIPLTHWLLGFTFQRIVTNANEVKIVQQIGDYYLIGSDQVPTIDPEGSFTIKLQGKYTLRNKDDLPADYFLILHDDEGRPSEPIPITAKYELLPFKPNSLTPGINDYELNIQHEATSIEGNPPEPMLPLESSLIVPLPVDLIPSEGHFILKHDTTILVQGEDKGTLKTAEMLSQDLSSSTGYPISVQQISSTHEQPENSILFTNRNVTDELGSEGYLLQVTAQRVTIQASSAAGFFYATQSLKQLFPPEIWKKQAQISTKAIDPSNNHWQLPCLSIKDYPRFPYRGVLLDSARHFFTTDQIKRLLDLMAMHKLNMFHWHLTDDEGWRIQIQRYPMLTEIGAWRGYGLPLPPALGSGAKRYGGFYTQDDIRDIVRYAKERYITIIPEIDMPAHSRALIKSMPDKLQDDGDPTIYSSVRGFHDNVLSPCMETTYKVIKEIMAEVVELFPGGYVHIGVDERPINAWKDSPACKALMKKENLKDTDELQNYFVKKIQNILTEKNRSIAAWEEALKGGKLNQKSMPMIYAWKSIDAGIKAAEEGYDVILSPASATYLELAYSADPFEPGDYWSGYVDTFTVYAFRPIPPNLSVALRDRIKGIEGSLWSEYIRSADLLDYFAFPKLSALAEVAWTPASRRNWRNFSTRMSNLHLPRLDQYGVNYRISPPGIQVKSYLLKANNEFSGMLMRYTLDGSLPTPDSEMYKGPVKIKDELAKMRAFNTLERGSSVVESK